MTDSSFRFYDSRLAGYHVNAWKGAYIATDTARVSRAVGYVKSSGRRCKTVAFTGATREKMSVYSASGLANGAAHSACILSPDALGVESIVEGYAKRGARGGEMAGKARNQKEFPTYSNFTNVVVRELQTMAILLDAILAFR